MEVEIYTKSSCPYCNSAKLLLNQKGASFKEYDVSDEKALAEMVHRSHGKMTVPQIFIGNEYIGGFDDLHALDFSGQLDVKLGIRQ